MEISNKAIVGGIGLLMVRLVSLLLHSGYCLWGILLIVPLVQCIED